VGRAREDPQLPLCRGTLARITIDRLRHLALQTFRDIGHLLDTCAAVPSATCSARAPAIGRTCPRDPLLS
jgi:hypothetical protein